MRNWAIFALLLGMGAGCMFEPHSVDAGNGGLEGEQSANGEGAGGAGGDLGLGGMGGGSSFGGADGDSGGGSGSSDAVDPSDPATLQPACAPSTEETDCPGTSCDPATLRCSTYKIATRPTCWTCVSDSDCESSDDRCVAMNFNGARFPDAHTGFCLQIAVPGDDEDDWEFDDEDDSNCSAPYTQVLIQRASLSNGTLQSYCGVNEALTTCYAVRAFENQEACPDGRDDECPTGAICRRFGEEDKATNCCTYACNSDRQCPVVGEEAGTCGGYCGG